ncbi:hypothetical protein SeMB42_g07236 [Synchytrium endobioticum]|uniref:Xrn1 N-terminal domain-containing protein n=1 Tax=Synchytrium endobioticum TaxID=286115 RepID=A0A507CV98_9FUNG|nr:hypothetical protein SeMB42_g07236 [Synchytrium endobioticum]TPX42951.1 hypothetical protein SeLEV6574_g05323 [Synchytrium endobioticum]
MGIQGFFAWLRQLTPAAFSKSRLGPRGRGFDHVLVDCNHLIHRAAAATHKKEKVLQILSGLLWKNFQSATTPAKSVFFAVDGPGPLAKMIEQRRRRVDSHAKILKKEGKAMFHPGNLTPGCHFMNRVDDFLVLFASRAFAVKKWKKPLSVTVSGSRVPGEGELKLIQEAKHLMLKRSNDSYAFITSDADIVALALASSLPAQIYNTFSHDFFDVQTLASHLSALFPTCPPNRIARDFALLTMFSGGDSIPKMRHVSMSGLWATYRLFKRKHPDLYLTVDSDRAGIHIGALFKYCQAGLDAQTLMAQHQHGLVHEDASMSQTRIEEWLKCMAWVLDGGLRGVHLDYSVLYEGELAPSPLQIVKMCSATSSSEGDQVVYASDSTVPPLCPEMCAAALLPSGLQPFIPYAFGDIMSQVNFELKSAGNDQAATIKVLRSLQSRTLPQVVKPAKLICVSHNRLDIPEPLRLTVPLVPGFTPNRDTSRYTAFHLERGIVDYSDWYQMNNFVPPVRKKREPFDRSKWDNDQEDALLDKRKVKIASSL